MIAVLHTAVTIPQRDRKRRTVTLPAIRQELKACYVPNGHRGE